MSTPTAAPVTKTRYYRPELDVLRFFACFLVFNHHVAPFLPGTSAVARLSYAAHTSGEFGVCIFFVLSAFLITELLLREEAQTGTIHLRGFYLRRVLRIWPLYFLLLALVIFLPVSSPHSAADWHRVLSFFLLAGNWSVVAHGWPNALFFAALWTIPLEEQFYLIWPSVAKHWGKRGIRAISILVLLASVCTLLFEAHRGIYGGTSIWCNSLVQFQFFAFGALLAITLHGRSIRISTFQRWAMVVSGLALMTMSCFFFQFYDATSLRSELLGFLFLDVAVILIFLGFSGAAMPDWTSPLTYLGKISYGLYLYQLLVAHYIEKLLHSWGMRHGLPYICSTYFLVGGGTLLLASTSYRYFETPFLRLKERFEFVKTRPT